MRQAIILLLAATAAAAVCSTSATRVVMPWVCLERCGDDISADESGVKEYADSLSSVSFEAYDLGSNGTLIDNGFTNWTMFLKDLNLGTMPMITTVDINKIRELFNREVADKFVETAARVALEAGYTGYNIDWEPCQGEGTCTDQDAHHYAGFLLRFGTELHRHNLKLTVDIASWSPFWNFTALAEVQVVDRFITMDTYAFDDGDYAAGLQKVMQAFGPARSGVGFCTDCGGTITGDQLASRIQQAVGMGAVEIDIWDWPLPADWWSAVSTFHKGG